MGEKEPEGLAIPFGETFRGPLDTFMNLVTDHGPVDVNFYVDGTSGPWRYTAVAAHASLILVEGVAVPVASLADVIDSKEAAGRDRDRRVLPTLISFLRGRPR